MRKRPGIITAICILGFIGALAFLRMLISDSIPKTIGSWYPPFLFVSAAAGLACMIGLWMMKKWSVIAYTCFFVLSQIVLLINDVWTPFSFIVPAIVIGIGFSQFSKMDPVSKVTLPEPEASQITDERPLSEMAAPLKKTDKTGRQPKIAGILCIVSGTVCIVFGGTGLSVSLFFSADSSVVTFYLIFLIMAVVLGTIAIISGIFAFKLEKWGLVLAGAICSCFLLFPIGIASVILLANSKKQFN